MLKQNREALSPDEVQLNQILKDAEKKNAELKKGLAELEKRGTLDPVLKPNGGPAARNLRIVQQSKEDIFQALNAVRAEALKEAATILARMAKEKQQHYSLIFSEVFDAVAIHPEYAASKVAEKNNRESQTRDAQQSKFLSAEQQRNIVRKDIDRDDR